QAARSQTSRVVVATDDALIQQTVQKHGYEALLTRADHPTGTDRLSEVAAQLGLAPESIVVNVQGDEPLIDPQEIDRVAQLLIEAPDAAIATCATPIGDADTLFNPSAVKVVCGLNGRALYFSRAPVPWARDALADGSRRLAPGLRALHHIGLYAYRAGFLARFPTLPVGPLETFESLEQLRAMENGFSIAVRVTEGHPAMGVDTQEDLERVREIFINRL
ncbi:MAG: 3-deoxy-manno-octulosonate cytidylyltransferase, partial [Burkholderiaceae bacterium]